VTYARIAVVLATFIALFITSLLVLPMTYALLVGIALVAAFILLDARRNRILFTMGRRNILRRKGTTALVVCGLMVGTAIISASFIVGDTLNNMIVSETTKGSGGADFVIEAPGDQGNMLFNGTVASSLEGDLLKIDNVGTVQSFLEISAGVLDNETQLSDTDAGLMGLTPGLLSDHRLIGSNGERISDVPGSGKAYINQKLATELDADVGQNITVFVGNSSVNLTVRDIVGYEGLGSYDLGAHAFVDLSVAQDLIGYPDHRNIVFLSLDDHEASDIDKARSDINETLQSYRSEGLKITGDKQRSIDQGLDEMATYTSLFFMLGSFSVIAGIVLIANIFTMLGEERKSEMGISRAIGMKRSQLTRVFTYEGMFYAAMAAGVGTFVGLALSYVLITWAADAINLGNFPIADYFYFTPFSLAVSYLMGFLITLGVVYATTKRISSLNIVRAVRNIPEPPLARGDRRSRAAGLLLFLGGAATIVLGVYLESQLFSMGGLSCVTTSLGFLLRTKLGDRAAWNISALATLFIWLPLPFDIFPYSGFIELFVLAGIFMVSAGLILVMFNSDAIIWFFTRVLRARKGYRAVVKTAISYPLKSKFRTALSIFIFGLVIFTVTTLSVMTAVLDNGIPKLAAETSGGYDIIAYTNPTTPIKENLWEYTNTSSSFIKGENLTGVLPLVSGRGIMRTAAEDPSGNKVTNDTPYNVIGFDSRLFTQGQYWLAEWDEERFASEHDVWQGVLDNSGLVILDGSMLSNELSDFASVITAKVGDEVVLTTSNGSSTFTVVGIMKQPVLTGMFVSHNFTEESMNITDPSVYLVNVKDGLDVDRQAALLEREFLANGMATIPVATVANEIVEQINGVFTLFRAFLGLGLIVGISGLGIITVRSIRERRLEIGMMRAIGYTKRMIITNFALESSFISFLGIVIGSLLGISVGYTVYLTAFEELGYDFLIPWWDILIVGLGAFLATLLSVYPAARGASKVSPAEVLRFE
jgi:putative ABC transport system permease protein